MTSLLVVAFAVVASVMVLISLGSVHQIHEGYVGVYWRGGALLPVLTEPGYHMMVPIFTQYDEVQITVQTDNVRNIPCGTSGGVMIYFESIEVINFLKKEFVFQTIKNYTINYDKTWIYDRIHHSVNQFCSSRTLQDVFIDQFDTIDDLLVLELQRDCNLWAPGIQIIGCRVTKPRIPSSIMQNFELMEAEKTKLLIEAQKQKVVEKAAETERKRQTIEAEMVKTVTAIRLEKEIMEQETSKKKREIEDTMHLAREKALADAEYYKRMQEATADKAKFTPEYLTIEYIRAITNNTKIYFGEKIPTMILENGALANDMQPFKKK